MRFGIALMVVPCQREEPREPESLQANRPTTDSKAFDGSNFLGSGERLEPRRLEPELPVIDSPARRRQLSAARRVRIRHLVVGARRRAVARESVATDADSRLTVR